MGKDNLWDDLDIPSFLLVENRVPLTPEQQEKWERVWLKNRHSSSSKFFRTETADKEPTKMPDQPIETVDYVKEYNTLADMATKLGHVVKRVNGFANLAEAEAKCEELNETVEALKTLKPKEVETYLASKQEKTKMPNKQMAKVADEKPAKPAKTKAAAPAPKGKAAKVTKPAKPEPKAAKGKATKPAKPETKANGGTLVERVLGARSAGTNKATVLQLLFDNIKKPVSRTKLIRACYGAGADPEMERQKFTMVIGGLIKMVEKNAKDHAITATKDDKDVYYVLGPSK